MKKLIQSTIFIISVTCFLVSCSKSDPNPTANGVNVAITSLSVNAGPYTTVVTIKGTGFSNILTDNKVMFNGKNGVIAAASATQITTSVPLAAGTGNVTVTVNGNTATGPIFTYQQTEVVTTFVREATTDGVGAVNGYFVPNGVITDGAGNVYITDQGTNVIRKITPAGVVSILAGNGQRGSTDGIGTAASFDQPSAIVIDQSGNLFVSDGSDEVIRKITQAGVVSTFAQAGGSLAIDGSGNLFVAEQSAEQIKKITPDGTMTTFHTGGSFYGLTIDKTGNLFAVALDSNAIIKITPSGVSSVFAGGNFLPISNDGTGTAASFDEPYGITIDSNGNLFVIESDQYIREITPGAIVTTFAGRAGGASDGPLATAGFLSMKEITIDASGNIYVADQSAVRKISFQ